MRNGQFRMERAKQESSFIAKCSSTGNGKGISITSIDP
jgi:hypothetical protein